MKSFAVRLPVAVAVALLACLVPQQAADGASSAMTKNSGDEARAMYQVQSHLRIAEDKLTQVKDDDAKTDVAQRMSAVDRATLLKDVREEIAGAQKSLAEGKAALNSKAAGDFTKRLAQAGKALEQAMKGPKPPLAPKPAAK